jgi:hypothetical protein
MKRTRIIFEYAFAGMLVRVGGEWSCLSVLINILKDAAAGNTPGKIKT